MNIAYVLPGFSADDQDAAIPAQDDLVTELAARHELRVITLRYPHRTQPYRWRGIAVHPLGGGQTRAAGRLILWQRAHDLIQRLHQQRPFDVIHATWADETGLVAVRAARALGIPSVVSAVGGECVRLDAVGYGLQRSAFSRWIVRQALSADAVVAISPYQARLVASVSGRRAQVLPLGIPIESIMETNEHRSTERLIHAGSLVPVKQQVLLLHALSRLPSGVTLEIYGDGPERRTLEAETAALGLHERVRFPGAVPRARLFSAMAQAALHVQSSAHEAQCMAVVEAAACGTASVGTAVGALADDRALGTAISENHPEALARAIQEALPRAEAMGEIARARARSAYGVSQTAQSLSELYAQISAAH